jgi:hypothetical protein
MGLNRSLRFNRLRVAELALAGGAAAFGVALFLPWAHLEIEGNPFIAGTASVDGFFFRSLVIAMILLGGAAVWRVLPALGVASSGRSRSYVALGLVGTAALLTIVRFAVIASEARDAARAVGVDAGLSVGAYVGLAAVAAACVFTMITDGAKVIR